MEVDDSPAMVELDEYKCDESDDCDAAYPHPLLLEQHKWDEHPAWRKRLRKFASGELPKVDP